MARKPWDGNKPHVWVPVTMHGYYAYLIYTYMYITCPLSSVEHVGTALPSVDGLRRFRTGSQDQLVQVAQAKDYNSCGPEEFQMG